MFYKLKKVWPISLILIIFASQISCKKYLDAKPNLKLNTISTLGDLQSLMDNYPAVNWMDPGSVEAAADNYYMTDQNFSFLPVDERNMYKWNKELVFKTNSPANDWSWTYDNVYRANTVLFHLDKIEKSLNNQNERNNIKGQALFLRGRSFLNAVSIWSLAYDEASASADLGVPLRLTPDFNERSIRSTVRSTYEQIINDIKEAAAILPVTPTHVLRSSKPAAYALLARTYLFMRKYDSCFKYSNLCLQLKSELLDYNIPPASNTPFNNFRFELNPEIIMHNSMAVPGLIQPSLARIDSNLFQSYANDDLRKTMFFRSNTDNTYRFKGSYFGSANNLWSGIATDEVYLMRAECYARSGLIHEAMNDLNKLMKKRWSNSVAYPVIVATDAADALNKVLTERRKELIMRGIRWMDVKRLNKEGASINLTRIINGHTYTLPPNDLRYALAIPEDIIALSGMQQNPR